MASGTVDIALFENGKLSAVFATGKTLDFFGVTWLLVIKLVTWEPEYLEATILKLLVNLN